MWRPYPNLLVVNLICVLLSIPTPAFSQSATNSMSGTPVRQTIRVLSESISRSALLHLTAGDQIEVTGDSEDSRFAVDLFLYKTSASGDQVLVAKDDGDVDSPVFSYRSSIAGEYTLLARNLGSAAGTVNISVSRSKDIGSKGSMADAPYAQMKIFFATDRILGSHNAQGQQYGSEPDPSGTVHFGECTVSIPRDHRMGELEGPSIFHLEFTPDPAKHVVLQSAESEEENAFFKAMRSRNEHSQKKQVFLFIHGFANTFSDAATRTAQMAYDLGFDGPAVFYSWPSQGKIGPLSYNEDVRNAELTAANLRDFLTILAARSGASTIHIVAHSMGNRALTSALSQMRAAPDGSNTSRLGQILLVAPDVDAALFKKMAPQLKLSAQRLTLYASSRDEALEAAHLYAGYARAGEGGPSIVVLPGIDTVDASKVDTSLIGFYHQYYGDNSQVLSDFFHVMKNEAISARFGLQQQVLPQGVIWQLKSARH